MTLPPIIGRSAPRLAEVRARKAEASGFTVPEPQASAGPEALAAAVAPTSLLALQAEGEPPTTPARAMSAVAGGAIRNLNNLQLALLRADRIPDHLLRELAEAAAQLAQAGEADAAEWRPLLMRLKVELARHTPDMTASPLI